MGQVTATAPDIITKSYVQPDGSALVICPECGFQKIIETRDRQLKTNRIKVRCKCSTQFTLQLEFRKFFRKDVELRGECSFIPANGSNQHITLVNLSMGGACIQLDTPQPVAADTQGLMTFTLDDRNNSKIVKRFTVKYVAGNRVHCEFYNDKEYQRELGFYLRQ